MPLPTLPTKFVPLDVVKTNSLDLFASGADGAVPPVVSQEMPVNQVSENAVAPCFTRTTNAIDSPPDSDGGFVVVRVEFPDNVISK